MINEIQNYLEQKGYSPNEASTLARKAEVKIEAIQAESLAKQFEHMTRCSDCGGYFDESKGNCSC